MSRDDLPDFAAGYAQALSECSEERTRLYKTLQEKEDQIKRLQQDLRDRNYNIKVLESAAKGWMEKYDAMKAKYEPMVIVPS